MNPEKREEIVGRILDAVEELLPEYLRKEVEWKVNNGHSAVCVIDDAGRVWGRMFGDDKARLRSSFKTAQSKAGQVWLTGMATGDYEESVYTRKVEWRRYGIPKPELIGWQGGIPVALGDGDVLAVGFSGFREETDRELVTKAAERVLGRKIQWD